jgi:uncharacterized membrane protein YjjB (DUF3815 family)
MTEALADAALLLAASWTFLEDIPVVVAAATAAFIVGLAGYVIRKITKR